MASGNYTATLTTEMVPNAYNLNADPDHHTVTYFNFPTYTVPLLDEFWSGRDRRVVQVRFPQSQLQEGLNRLTLWMRTTTAVPSLSMYFDKYAVQYARRFQATNEQLLFPGQAAGRWQYHLTNFSANTLHLWDVSQPLTPTRLLGGVVSVEGAGWAVDFEVTQTVGATYLAVSSAGVRTPMSITRVEPSGLGASTNGADYVLITHRDLLTATQTLANYRAAQGWRVKVVDIDTLYNDFNAGIFHPVAIKNFLAYAYANWQAPALQYAILIGEGSWNTRNFTTRYGTPPPMQQPPNLAWVDPNDGEVEATSLLGAIVGLDPFPDVSLGRLSAATNVQLSGLVNKIMAYEQLGSQAWNRQLVFVADNADGAGDFGAISNEVINAVVPPVYTVTRLYLDDYITRCGGAGAAACLTKELTRTLNITGALILNYTGHGAINGWAGEGLLAPNPIYALTNTNQLPIVLAMTCLEGNWYYGWQSLIPESLAESFLRANGGAIATFSPTGRGVATGHDVLHRGFLSAFFQEGQWSLGAAAQNARLAIYNSGMYYDLLDTFVLFGDPLMQVPNPYRMAVTGNPLAQAGNPGQTLTYTVRVTNTGTLTDNVRVQLLAANWTTLGNVPTVNLVPGASQTVNIPLVIQPNAPAFVTDAARVWVSSAGDVRQGAAFTLTVNVNRVTGNAWSPATSTQLGLPSQWVTHTFTVTNTGNYTDTFTLTLGATPWATTALPATTGALGMGASRTFTVAVAVPANALYQQAASVLITATSQTSPTTFASAQATTSAGLVVGLLSAPAQQWAVVNAGDTLTHTFTVTNTGNYTDTFTVGETGGTWGWAYAPTLVVPPLGGSRSVTLTAPAPLGSEGQLENVTLTFTSANNPARSQTVLAQTLVRVAGMVLAPTDNTLTGVSGQWVTHTLTLTNTGNYTDTFALGLSPSAWSTTWLPATGPLGSGLSQVMTVAVYIPAEALYQDIQTITLTATSQAQPAAATNATLTTTVALVTALGLTPPHSALETVPNTWVTHTFAVANLGNYTDTFTVTATGGVWNRVYSPTLGLLGPGAQTTFTLGVEVPPGSSGQSDNITLTATAANDPLFRQEFTARTLVWATGTTLTAFTSAQTALPGETVTYTLQVTNTGSYTDTFDLTLGPSPWAAATSEATGPLAAGAGRLLTVTVTVPPNALYQQFASVQLTATSQANLNTSASTQFTTTAGLVAGLSVAPAQSQREASLGQWVTHTFTVTNLGNAPDTFTMTVTGGTWSWVYSPTLTIAPGDSALLLVQARVPFGLPDGRVETVNCLLTSTNNPSRTQTVTAQTVVRQRLYLPLVRR